MFEASPSEITVTFYTGNNEQFAEKFADEFVEKFVENENQRTILKLMLIAWARRRGKRRALGCETVKQIKPSPPVKKLTTEELYQEMVALKKKRF